MYPNTQVFFSLGDIVLSYVESQELPHKCLLDQIPHAADSFAVGFIRRRDKGNLGTTCFVLPLAVRFQFLLTVIPTRFLDWKASVTGMSKKDRHSLALTDEAFREASEFKSVLADKGRIIPRIYISA